MIRLHPRLRRGLVSLLPLLVLFVAVSARLAAPRLLDRLSVFAFDFYQREAPRIAPNLPIRIVNIDDKSLREIGQWPWPRTIIAELVDKLREDGAAVIGLDIVFSEPDRTAPKMLLPLLVHGGVPSGQAADLLAAMHDPDQSLAEAFAKAPVVNGFILTNEHGNRAPAIRAGFAFVGDRPLEHVPDYTSAIANLPALEAASSGNGFVNQSLDWDHIVRRVPLVLRLDGKPVPSLAAEILRVVSGAQTYIGRAAGAHNEADFGESTGLTALRIGRLTVPTDAGGRVWVHYAVPPPDLYVSAADVLAGKVDRSKIADNIVLIGTSAEGVINDQQATPLSPDVPGVEIHAQLIGEILQGSYLVRPDWAIGAEILFTVVIGMLLVYALQRIGALGSAGLGVAAVAGALAVSWLAFRHLGMLIDPVYPSVVLVLVYLLATLLGYLRTEARQREIRSAFSRYMSPHYVEELASHPERLALGGQKRSMTIMFCDIRGFTSLSEKLDAEALTHFMNSFLSPMTEIITEMKGTIDKYIGDCIMAFWNAPLDDPEHAKNAVRAAQAMRRQLAHLNEVWRTEPQYQAFLPVRVGIGINTGDCVVGNFGSEQHFDYSLLGDPVNLASRLEGLGKVYGVDLVIGEETALALDDPALIELDLVAVKGKKQAGHVYTLPPEEIGEDRFIADHGALLTAYRRQDWAAALRLLDSGRLAAVRHLAPVYDLYRRRIAHFQLVAPPENWDGVFTAEEK
ncbi:MAG TPA: adenylate/guanylate cyclase domain-containing protein [Stellaceae bacterium]|nr:adenylate/guanylate cyclase domain-containing protein [Stellaceae bacterium]